MMKCHIPIEFIPISVPDYFHNTENDAESDLEIRVPAKKSKEPTIKYLFEKNHYNGEEDRKTYFSCKKVLGAKCQRLVMLSQSNPTQMNSLVNDLCRVLFL